MRMQVILDSSFARPGSAPIWGGKKVEFRDWTMRSVITRLTLRRFVYTDTRLKFSFLFVMIETFTELSK